MAAAWEGAQSFAMSLATPQRPLLDHGRFCRRAMRAWTFYSSQCSDLPVAAPYVGTALSKCTQCWVGRETCAEQCLPCAL